MAWRWTVATAVLVWRWTAATVAVFRVPGQPAGVQVAIVTVGEELLAGETENTNASWVGRQLTDRGARVTRVLTVPDEHAVIADAVTRYRESFDAVLVGGGLGGTHDVHESEALVSQPEVFDFW